ncbi:hypothetical protein EQG63_08480 [Flavobacterium amnicola]|uniref:HmuY protein n=1 Tax=Flavobacterium amnicola TaxID=2506422 RepID=A0A4V1N1U2_9FLAO|nr:HmuY family protein [Flavobacterium amnicola]RXR18296.1 hypothetical protein EQG63_08480 [Flavobacterium amnicola]
MKKTILFLSFALLALISCSKDEDINPILQSPTPPSNGDILQPAVGGANQPNQVFLDLSTEVSTPINRASWDFGFSSGADFRVAINGAVKMAVKQLATNDMSITQTEDSNVAVGAGSNPSSNGYCDNPTGVLAGAGSGIGTAIAEVSATDADNKVYLVNLGFAVSTTTPSAGSVSIDGASRGWKKVRFLRNGSNGYKIQYADLNSATYTERTIAKDADFNFTFFSMNTGNTVSVEPQKTKWDVCFTTFTNYVNFGSEVTYGYSDFITSNMKGGTKVYQVLTSEFAYDAFKKGNIVEANFTISATDQRIIGSNWRNGGGPSTLPSVKTDRFYVIKDAANNYYKVQFLAMTNDAGVRGNPTIQYAILK